MKRPTLNPPNPPTTSRLASGASFRDADAPNLNRLNTSAALPAICLSLLSSPAPWVPLLKDTKKDNGPGSMPSSTPMSGVS